MPLVVFFKIRHFATYPLILLYLLYQPIDGDDGGLGNAATCVSCDFFHPAINSGFPYVVVNVGYPSLPVMCNFIALCICVGTVRLLPFRDNSFVRDQHLCPQRRCILRLPLCLLYQLIDGDNGIVAQTTTADSDVHNLFVGQMCFSTQCKFQYIGITIKHRIIATIFCYIRWGYKTD